MKRFGVYSFPSLYGTPICADQYWLALLVFYCRSPFNVEVRLIDHERNRVLKVSW